MEKEKKLIEQLEQILSKDHVLTEVEDRYVYSFEKIFMKQVYPMPDIVVKVYSSDQMEKISELIEKKEEIIVIKRGEYCSPSSIEPSRIKMLLDDAKIPRLEISTEEQQKRVGIGEKFFETHKSGYGTYRNFALAVQTLFQDKFADSCFHCSTCSDYCTVTPSFKGIETWSARGRALLIKGIMTGELTLTNKIVDVLYTCSKCGRCFGECFPNVDLHEAIIRMRRYIVENNMAPPVFQSTAKNILGHGDPSATPIDRRLAWMKNISVTNLPEKADHLYFVGCMVAYRTPNTAKALFNILTHTNTDFTMLGREEGCCGYVLITSGLWEEAKQVANDLIGRIEKTRADSLITPCAGCYYTFKKLFPEILGVSLPCKVVHSTQFIEKMIENSEIKLGELNQEITYHDPCSLGRHSNVYEAPRNILKAIPGTKLIEMPFNKDQSRCCGGGGGLWTFNYRVSMESAHTRLREDLTPTDVDVLVTACPQCEMNFHLTSQRKSIPLQIKDIVEIVESAMYL